jgi:hypothetical protein
MPVGDTTASYHYLYGIVIVRYEPTVFSLLPAGQSGRDGTATARATGEHGGGALQKGRTGRT